MKRLLLGAAVAISAGCSLLISDGLNQADAQRDGGAGTTGDGGGTLPDGGSILPDGGGGPSPDSGPSDGGYEPPPLCRPPDGGFKPVMWTTQTLTGTTNAIWAANDSVAFAAGQGILANYRGQAWANVTTPDPTNVTFNGVGGSGPADVWAVGSDSNTFAGVIWHFDGGAWGDETPDWASMGVGAATLNDVWSPNPSLAVVVGSVSSGGLLLLHQGGTWIADAGAIPASNLFQVTADQSGTLWAAGVANNGLPGLFNNAGGTWQPIWNPGTGTDFEAVWVWSSNVGWIGGKGGDDEYTLNPMGDWVVDAFLNGNEIYPHGLWGSGANDVWAVSQFPNDVVAHWNGAQWTSYDLTTTPCTTSRWEQVTGSCHTLWLNFGGSICQGTR